MGIKVPEKCITVEEAKELQKSWCDTRLPEINSCLGFEDTREFWWSVKELKKYIRYVEKESKEQGIENPGIRAYFGAYPKEKCKMKKGYATLFLAPTGSPAGELGKGGDRARNNHSIQAYNSGSSGEPPISY
ncbi:hypothetical protein NBT05_13180 [Aquimarina sp. ERC-38]|uniref:hypothetical protein n=1 Tax=Aquimarina sp. ERC-38 TaxID=2949996 RepID=UPI002247C48D|nr:hypothetical protein [Aquimarina sp. ERC-38]UZO79897.1 hypothetical protein NBT05_13180 [Aquimarina sp. ERC-38]